MVDVIGNMALVRAFGGLAREHMPLRRDRRRRNECAPAQPALSGKVASRARPGRSSRRRSRCSPGRSSSGRRGARQRGRRRAGLHARPFGAERDARSRGGAGRRHAAHGAARRGAGDLAVAARAARPSRGRGAGPRGARVTFERRVLRLSRGTRSFPASASTFRPGQRVGLVGPSGGGKIDAGRADAAALYGRGRGAS